ncbi:MULTISPECIES: iron-enterobactin ABC transporter permease [Dickeya]|uniref:Iron ABC transporter permease n=1 Tax=Dickeya fangzhongdai TaxID=1778540 RepID=A0A2K8QNX3_9GAMM|nr:MULTISPECIES: iron-enterobactin ABC transporter permease [Dickeya]ATZ95186.1 iron ABC transporter permease [Dickeya fangzhongdai]AYH48895.1 iron ABC transporter permease [Dickeya fangzhongdai]MBO8135185.1 iron-enterobactin ABC transporter permease [Dickeya fangzhongdai]QOH48627.1 iron-enterobactin ABC transporter permease [Dickeya fangzhongdai]QOH52931.1 iron-enterobactin ABC transporter permease [Dickeya fangzhongdai]
MSTRTLFLRAPAGLISGRLPLRALWINLSLLLGGAALLTLAVSLGTLPLSAPTVWQALAGHGEASTVTVVTQWRAPRAVMALLLGAGLGVSGAIFQSLTRNPLGSPDVVGFNTGAHTGALVTIILLHGSYYQIAGGAVLGGLATALAVYLLAWRRGISGFRLIIVGIAVSAILSAFNTWLMITGALETVMTAALWGAGSLNGMTWSKAAPALLLIPLTLLATLLLARRLQLLEMGDDSARALGVNAEASRLWLMLCGIVLIAVVTASAGPISFIALAAPQIARRLTRASTVPLCAAALVGGLLLLTADIVAQHLFTGRQLPVGSVTVSIGGLYLIWLLIRESRR